MGRLYQAPALTVPRQTPVYGFNGIKAAAVVASATINHNPDLVVSGRSLPRSKSKSPSPQLSTTSNNNHNVNNINHKNNNSSNTSNGGHSTASSRTTKPRTSGSSSRVRGTAPGKVAPRGRTSDREKSWSPGSSEDNDEVRDNDNLVNNNDEQQPTTSDDVLASASSSQPSSELQSRLGEGLVRHPTKIVAAVAGNKAAAAADYDNNNNDDGEAVSGQVPASTAQARQVEKRIPVMVK